MAISFERNLIPLCGLIAWLGFVCLSASASQISTENSAQKIEHVTECPTHSVKVSGIVFSTEPDFQLLEFSVFNRETNKTINLKNEVQDTFKTSFSIRGLKLLCQNVPPDLPGQSVNNIWLIMLSTNSNFYNPEEYTNSFKIWIKEDYEVNVGAMKHIPD